MTTTLVIGAGGQIGSDLVPALTERGHEVHMFDLRPVEQTASAEHLAEAMTEDPGWRERWITGDAAGPELAATLERLRPDLVVHLAAILSATGEKDPARCWSVNMGSLERALDVLADAPGRPRLLWPSSIAAYGPLPGERLYDGHTTVPNEFPLHPTTMYGVTKVAGELLGSYAAERRGVDFRSLRFPGLLSATEPGGGSSDYANEMYFAAARGQASVEVFVEPSTTMPFLHMADAVSALIQLAEAPEADLTRRVYNVSGFAPTAEQFAASIVAAGCPLDVRYVPDNRQAIVDSWPDDMDDAPARADWGWSPAHDLDATTRRLLDEIRALLAV